MRVQRDHASAHCLHEAIEFIIAYSGELFDPELAQKPQIVVANKIDLPEARAKAKSMAKKLPKKYQPLHVISAATTEGVRQLVQRVGAKLDEVKREGEVTGGAARL